MARGDKVNLIEGQVPADYHCRCEYCTDVIGELRPTDGSHYSRLERREYYVTEIESSTEGGHIAKTPLHIARWAVQAYSKPGDWVLDPTIGAGTTAVEAITQGRNAAGMEIEFGAVIEANVRKNIVPGVKAEIGLGDARNIKSDLLDKLNKQFALVVNNPPYFGDISMPSPSKQQKGLSSEEKAKLRHTERRYDYDKSLPNLAFLKENGEYWQTIEDIYRSCCEYLIPGGHFVVGVKDTMKNKQPYPLHKDYADVLSKIGLGHVGTAFLKHHPGTLALNSYEKRWGIKPATYQTIAVFQKEI
jgi:DNA modification methylase